MLGPPPADGVGEAVLPVVDQVVADEDDEEAPPRHRHFEEAVGPEQHQQPQADGCEQRIHDALPRPMAREVSASFVS